ncbi:MAG: ABC transporter ATP-binding protein [Chloroflexota bacterium]
MTEAIIVDKVEKQFRRYEPNRPKKIKSLVMHGLKHGMQAMTPTETFTALKDISFSVTTGQTVGIIGANGSGKSTLLRLLGNVGRPDKGCIKTQGQIRALLDLGANFQSELTGRENLFLSGVMLGLTRRKVAGYFDDIVRFAELEHCIDNPLRTYSTGMQMRLAFALATFTEPDILLIDEVLAVGDLAFQQKCYERINQFKAEGCTIVLVSHDMAMIEQLCDHVIWLRDGQIAEQGLAAPVVAHYMSAMTTETAQRTPDDYPDQEVAEGTTLRIKENRFGSLEMEITAVRLLNAAGECVESLQSGQPLSVEIAYQAPTAIQSPIFGLTITLEDGFICYDTTTELAGLSVPTVNGSGKIRLEIDRLDLNGGKFFVNVGVYEQAWRYTYDYHWQVYPFYIQPSHHSQGILQPPTRWIVGQTEQD